MRRAVTVLLLLLGPAARADRAAELDGAARALAPGDYGQAERGTRPLLADPRLLRAERAEAYRVHGLSLYFQRREPEAEAALRQYLTMEPDAHLDPALYPPEAVLFFEAVRARHRGAVISARPPPRRRRTAILNLVPPLGQVQNGQHAKAWIIGGAEVALLGANIATYSMLSSACKGSDLTCDRDPSLSRALRTVNLVSGGLFLAVYAYGVNDGYVGYSRAGARERARAVRTALVPLPGGALLGASAAF
jgi:hypothetical protein